MSIEKSLSREEKIKNVFDFFGVSIKDKVSVLLKKAGAKEYDWEDGEVFGADFDKEELIIKLLSGEIIRLNKSQINDLEKSDAEDEDEDEDEDEEEEEEEIDEEFIKNLPPEKRKYFKKIAARLEEKKFKLGQSVNYLASPSGNKEWTVHVLDEKQGIAVLRQRSLKAPGGFYEVKATLKTLETFQEKKSVDAEEVEEELEEEIKPEIKFGSRVVFVFRGKQESGKVISAEENGFVKVIKDSDKKTARVAVNKLSLEVVETEEEIEEEEEELEEGEGLENDRTQERIEKLKNQTEKLINKYNKELVEESDNDKKETIRHKLKNLDIIYTAKNFEEAKDRIDRSLSLSKEEKISLFESMGISKEDFEKIDNEAVSKLKKKLQEYIEAENKIIKEVEKIPQGKRMEKQVKYLNNASTRIITWKYMSEKTDWTVGDYKFAIQNTFENPIIGTNFYVILEERFNELMEIVRERDEEIMGIILKPEAEKTEEEIKQEILEFFGVEIGDRVKVRFDKEDVEEYGVEEDFGIVVGAGMEFAPDYDEEKEPEKEKVIKIKFKNTNIGTLSILKDEKNQGDVKKATDEEREKMILSELYEEIKKMYDIVATQRDEGKITIEQFFKKNSALEWIEKTKDIKTAKEMIGMALNTLNKGGINEEEARKLYGILEISEDEINELVKGEEKWDIGQEKEKIEHWAGLKERIIEDFVTGIKIIQVKEEDRGIVFDLLKTIDGLKENKSKEAFDKNITDCESKFVTVSELYEEYKKQEEKLIEEKWQEIVKNLIPDARNKVKTQTEEDYKKLVELTENGDFLNRISKDESFREAWGNIGEFWGQTGGRVEVEVVLRRGKINNIISQMAEIIKKELAAGGEEKPPEKKEIEIKGFADIERFLAEKKGKQRNARMEEIDARLEEIARILKKAVV